MNAIYNLLAKRAKVDSIEVGQELNIDVDFALTHDGSMPKIIESFNSLKEIVINYGNKLHVTVDHFLPAPDMKARQSFKAIDDFCRRFDINLYKNGEGILHQVFAEKFAGYLKDKIVVGVDGHMCTSAGLGALPFSITPEDMLQILRTGQYKLLVPKVVNLDFHGEFLCDNTGKSMAAGKDIALYTIKEAGISNLKNNGIVLRGQCLKMLTESQKMTISNMLGEVGAKTVYFVEEDLEDQCEYYKVVPVDAEKINRVIALPGAVDNVVTLVEVQGEKVSQVYIGGCTNGRIDDMEQVANILKDRTVHSDVTLIVSPASRKVANEMDKLGYSEIIRNSGGIIINPGCGACSGIHQGVLGETDVVVTTTPRNSSGRMGDKNAQIYLASPKTAAMAAVEGMLVSEF
jgi:3-isopropylmalate/(R)-2-methylmalate dehydratase large subunit